MIKTLEDIDGFPSDLEDTIRSISPNAAEVLGLNWVGLDLMCRDGNYYDLVVVEGQTDCGVPAKKRFDLFAYAAKQFADSALTYSRTHSV